ncbi:FAD-dependent 5-carboxymethylaminomethyl-2-thiouridine(34) oxidoreductase MnmC [Marinobacter sp.]|uniref:FAD-dependent 5-carboxymethylaminomethyl-2-thiouridine(34) oxidoreductase MnmC n=1 Tax=Marinobacter sp. TaxID=50741 RepID=UPI0034A5C2EE
MTRRNNAPAVEPADLVWRDGVPESKAFGEVYFSRENGLDESRSVFIRPNRLPERFAALAEDASFVIGETGFGTGLNFLAAWQTWRNNSRNNNSRMHFVSVEPHPLTRNDLQRALAVWPELSELAEQLLAHYPPLVSGAHRILLDEGRVRLTLYFGEVLDARRELTFKADAWSLASLGATGGTLRGELPPSTAPCPAQSVPAQPASVTIIGAGVAGCLLARNLAERGVQVTLIDSADGPAAGASGNLQGALYAKLGIEFNAQTQLALSALLFSQRFYGRFQGDAWHPTGLLQVASEEKERNRQQRFVQRTRYPHEIVEPVDAATASRLVGIRVEHGGLWFSRCGWLQPSALCHTLTRHPRITTLYSTRVDRLSQSGESWQIVAEQRSIEADRVVLCGGHQTPTLIPIAGEHGHFRFKTIRGQVSHLPDNLVNSPSAVVCGLRYINPVCNGLAVTGATFDLHDDSPDVSLQSHQENVKELNAMVPAIWRRPDEHESHPNTLNGRVCFRCTTYDYQPVAGELPDIANSSLNNLFLLTGLGSKGLTYAPLLAEYLADILTDEPACLPASLVRRVQPGRCFKPALTSTD